MTMETFCLFADISSMDLQSWILLVFGLVFLLFGATLYYSAIKLFGAITGAILGLLVTFNSTQATSLSEATIILIFIGAVIVGAAIGSMIAMIFHHLIFFTFGAIIGLVLFKMFALKLVTPESFNNVDLENFIQMIKPTSNLEWLVLIVGGVVYMASAQILIVGTMAILGGFLVAVALNIYYLFPVLAVFGAILQYMMTRRQRIRLVAKPHLK